MITNYFSLQDSFFIFHLIFHFHFYLSCFNVQSMTPIQNRPFPLLYLLMSPHLILKHTQNIIYVNLKLLGI